MKSTNVGKFYTPIRGLGIFIKMVTIVAVASISMLARGEGATLKNTSEKSIDVTRKKIELRVLPRPATSSIEQCAQILQEVSDQSEQVKRVRKTLKKNLHWKTLGSGHQILSPGWYADYSDSVAAHAAMSEDDIPVLVSLVGRGGLKRGMPSITFSVLGQFGAKALPCIEAGIAYYKGEGASDLNNVKNNIEVKLRYPDPNRSVFSPNSDQPRIGTEKGGK